MSEPLVTPQQPPSGFIPVLPNEPTPIGTASIAMNGPSIPPSKLKETFEKAVKDQSFPPSNIAGRGNHYTLSGLF